MITYKLKKSENRVTSVLRSDGWEIPFAVDNSDYANFKKDLANGAELQDSEGVIMTEEQVNQFIETLS